MLEFMILGSFRFYFLFKMFSATLHCASSKTVIREATDDIMPLSCVLPLHFRAGRQVCSGSHLSRPSLSEKDFCKCYPYCPEMCTYGEERDKNMSQSWWWRWFLSEQQRFLYKEKALTLCHIEYSRAHTKFSGMTRCHDMSSPTDKEEKRRV